MRRDSSYLQLPNDFFQLVEPESVPRASYLFWNQDLADSLAIDESEKNQFLDFLSGNDSKLFQSFAQAYAGHQFGHFNILGDGRALMIGEFEDPQKSKFDLQLKGSGATPYSRNGDGKASLGPMLRELIVSEAMAGLGIPTTRSLAVLLSGESVQRRTFERGGILIRTASSHLRVGTFQFAKFRETQLAKQGLVRELADYSIERHYPSLLQGPSRYFEFFKSVLQAQAKLIAHWMAVGFIHGVMNTDNMTISGETIDYGPCAFMDRYDPDTVFSSIDQKGRYRFGRQPAIAQWNLARFAETLLEHFDSDPAVAAQMAEAELQKFPQVFQQFYEENLRKKLGLTTALESDAPLFESLFREMHQRKLDYTSTFMSLSQGEELLPEWTRQWRERVQQESRTPYEAQQMMMRENPLIIPRNYWVEHFIEQTSQSLSASDLIPYLKALKNPFSEEYLASPWRFSPEMENYQTYCGT